MPQIYMMRNRTAGEVLLGNRQLEELGRILMRVVEEDFDLKGLNNVAFSVPELLVRADGEKDVQLEIRYTAGEDEYGWGRPFDPSLVDQYLLCEHLREAFLEFLRSHGLQHLSVSVWCKPHYSSAFKAWD